VAQLFALRQRSERSDQDVAAVAHELNNVLTAISGYAQLVLTEGEAPPGVLRDVGEISAAAARAIELSRKLQGRD
jgi:signal transduction histidine kinase